MVFLLTFLMAFTCDVRLACMNTNPLNDAVAAQYERWPLPSPSSSLSSAAPVGDIQQFFWQYWPSATYREDLDILIAGCGTSQAAAMAHRYPAARILGVDVSQASIDCERRLKERYELSNLELLRMPLEEVRGLNRQFDFVSAYGVIHHIAEPAVGMRVIHDVLKKDGVASFMVYGRYGRDGIHNLQRLFAMLGTKQDAGGVQMVRDVIGRLSKNHHAQVVLSYAQDLLVDDSAIVDAFLNVRERSYTVGECLELVANADLAFQGWLEPGAYYPELFTIPGTPFAEQLKTLNDGQVWQAMELWHSTMSLHCFVACRSDRDPATYMHDFTSEAFLGYTPMLRAGVTAVAEGNCFRLERPPFPAINLTPLQATVVSRIDGLATVRNICGSWRIEHAQQFLRTLWRVGFIHFRMA